MAYIKAINRYDKQPDGAYRVQGSNFGKITGTMLAGILGKSPWATPFSTACKLFRIYDEDISDRPSVNAGKVLEPVILNYLDRSGRLENTQADVLFPHYEEGSHLDWKSHFDHPIFSGHIDAVAGHTDSPLTSLGIVENKTTANPEAWDFINNVPPTYYWLQASLYAWAFGLKDIYFTVGILTSEEQANPYSFRPTEENVRIMKVGIMPDFDRIIETVIQWYNDYIKNALTPVPDFTTKTDGKICAVLDAQKCTADMVIPKFDAYLDVVSKIAELEKQRDSLKEQITAYLDANGLNGIGNGNTSYKWAEYSRTAVDTDRMKADGIYEQYTKTSVSKQFRKGKF